MFLSPASGKCSAIRSQRPLPDWKLAGDMPHWCQDHQTGLSSRGSDPRAGLGSETRFDRKRGYIFNHIPSALATGTYNTCSLQASPAVPNSTGIRYFHTEPSGVIRLNVGAPAGPSSSPVQ